MGMKNIRNRSTTSRYVNLEKYKNFHTRLRWPMNNVFELYYDQTPSLPAPPTYVDLSVALPCHPHAQMHIIYIYIIADEHAQYILYYIFLKPSFCRRDVCARGELMWICAFLWFGFHAQRYLFARCTWREFLLSTRLLTATDIIVGILFSPARPVRDTHIYTIYYYTTCTLIFQTSDWWRYYGFSSMCVY